MLDYLPISLSSLRTDTVTGCDIFLLVHIDGDTRYILYSKEDALFDSSKRNLLTKKNINRLFINKKDQSKFSDYLESNFYYALTNGRISPSEKLKIAYNTAINVIQDVFEAPNTTNIMKTRNFAHNIVELIVKDVKISYNLLKLQSQDSYTYARSISVAALGTMFAHGLGLKRDDLIQLCAGMFIYDLGKTRVKHEILEKEGKLTEEEFEMVKKHPELGVNILNETGKELNDENIITLQHHENCDGSGYPYGLKKDDIHTSARIVRIVDIYDALTTKRPYANAQTPYDAIKTINNDMSNAVDPVMFKNFIKFLGGIAL